MGAVLSTLNTGAHAAGSATFRGISYLAKPLHHAYTRIDAVLMLMGEVGARVRANPYYVDVGLVLTAADTLVDEANSQPGDPATNFYEDIVDATVKKLS